MSWFQNYKQINTVFANSLPWKEEETHTFIAISTLNCASMHVKIIILQPWVKTNVLND